jgi:hypothetical protein
MPNHCRHFLSYVVEATTIALPQQDAVDTILK